jgi:poly(hydroxyalkanoate) depolymerase family esterase
MLFAVPDFGSNPGALDMYEYAPADLPADRPLVVVLHGCTQQASAMEAAGWNAVADEQKFAVVYAQQRSANQSLSCFTWYASGDISRDSGEAQSIIQMVDHAIAEHHSDRSRVYVTGLSAGGAFTTVMLAAYPDRFAAGSIMAGLPYHCATDVSSAQSCQQMNASTQKSATEWGDLVRAADPGFAGPYPRVQIFQGTSDYTVAPANATELVKQWTNVWATDATADVTTMTGPATVTQYTRGQTVAVELYSIANMGHGIAIGDDGSGTCPSHTGAFFNDVKLCSTLHAAAFFGLLPGDGQPPPDMGGSGSGGGDDDATNADGGCNAAGQSSLLIAFAALALASRSIDEARRRRPAPKQRRRECEIAATDGEHS